MRSMIPLIPGIVCSALCSNAVAVVPLMGEGYLQPEQAIRMKLQPRDVVSLKGDGMTVLSRGIVRDQVLDKVTPMEHRPALIFTAIPSFGRTDVQWIVRGNGKAEIRFHSLKARDRTLAVEFK